MGIIAWLRIILESLGLIKWFVKVIKDARREGWYNELEEVRDVWSKAKSREQKIDVLKRLRDLDNSL